WHPVLRWMAATLDGRVEATGAVFEDKFMLPWSFSEETAAEKYTVAAPRWLRAYSAHACILVATRRARSRCTTVHSATLFTGNRWRPAGFARARLRPAAPAIKHRTSITGVITRHRFSWSAAAPPAPVLSQ